MSGFLEKVVSDKKRWREYKRRVEALPVGYGEAVEALERYLMCRGAITTGDTLVSMLEDLADVFEQAAAADASIRGVVGDDPVRFADEFLLKYSEGEWIDKERKRLVEAIARAEAENGGERS